MSQIPLTSVTPTEEPASTALTPQHVIRTDTMLGYQEAALAAQTQQVQQTQQQEATRQRQATEEQQRQQQWAEDARAAAVLAALPEAQREAYRQRVRAELPAFLREMEGMVEQRMRAVVIAEGLVPAE